MNSLAENTPTEDMARADGHAKARMASHERFENDVGEAGDGGKIDHRTLRDCSGFSERRDRSVQSVGVANNSEAKKANVQFDRAEGKLRKKAIARSQPSVYSGFLSVRETPSQGQNGQQKSSSRTGKIFSQDEMKRKEEPISTREVDATKIALIQKEKKLIQKGKSIGYEATSTGDCETAQPNFALANEGGLSCVLGICSPTSGNSASQEERPIQNQRQLVEDANREGKTAVTKVGGNKAILKAFLSRSKLGKFNFMREGVKCSSGQRLQSSMDDDNVAQPNAAQPNSALSNEEELSFDGDVCQPTLGNNAIQEEKLIQSQRQFAEEAKRKGKIAGTEVGGDKAILRAFLSRSKPAKCNFTKEVMDEHSPKMSKYNSMRGINNLRLPDTLEGKEREAEVNREVGQTASQEKTPTKKQKQPTKNICRIEEIEGMETESDEAMHEGLINCFTSQFATDAVQRSGSPTNACISSQAVDNKGAPGSESPKGPFLLKEREIEADILEPHQARMYNGYEHIILDEAKVFAPHIPGRGTAKIGKEERMRAQELLKYFLQKGGPPYRSERLFGLGKIAASGSIDSKTNTLAPRKKHEHALIKPSLSAGSVHETHQYSFNLELLQSDPFFFVIQNDHVF